MAVSSRSLSRGVCKPIALSFALLFYCSHAGAEDPTPMPWPEQFHSSLVVNATGKLQIIDLWYDWPNGRNLNLIQDQYGKTVHDVEWTNGTSSYYTLDENKECKTVHFDVGILPPNWLQGATYLGQKMVDGFLCNAWTKVDFIWYYEDVVTKRPVHWLFYTGRAVHLMNFEVGAVLEDAKWQAHVYCFEKAKQTKNPKENIKLYSAMNVADDLAHKIVVKSLVSYDFLQLLTSYW